MSTLAYRIRVSGVDAQLPLKGIVTTGEVLLPSYRELFQQVFGCPVYDRYGLAEVSGYVAQECSFHQGLHVNGSISILEVIRDGHACGPGEAGKIVVTNLHNYAMPLIRYETGDTGTIGDECACGRAFSILAKIEGRSADWVATESYPVPIASFIGALEELRMRSIEKFQFNQTRAGELRLLVAPSSAITNGELYNLRQRMESVHPMVKVQVEAVDSIESTSGEKHERFKSVLGAKSR
jgi:phenylacetate-CoA ligase